MSNNKDYFVQEQIEDTIQCMKFCPIPNVNYLATGGWDNKLRIFNINYNVFNQNTPNEDAQIVSNLEYGNQHNSPIFSISWGSTGNIFTGCADGSVNHIDITKNNLTKLGSHKNACKEVIYHQNYNILLTGGWDGVVNVFDLRSSNIALSYQFDNKVYTMSCVKDLFVVGLSELKIGYFNLAKLQSGNFKPELIFNSHLKYQTRKVCVFPDGKGFAEGSIEGRVAIKNIKDLNVIPPVNNDSGTIMGKDEQGKDDFAFRCHRSKNPNNNTTNPISVYAVNDIAFNPVYGTFCTVGSDGVYSIWDKLNRSRLFERPENADKTPLTCCDYNSSGNLLAFGVGYDWSRGAEAAKEYSRGSKIGIHYLPPTQRKK
jgi:mRNA export factor